MSKITVITDNTGKIHAIGHGHLSEATTRKNGQKGLQGGLRPLANQQLHELELSQDVSQIKDFKALVEKIRPHLKISA
jgi:hypothetical protein